MKKLTDYYAVVLTSKWFYFSILATVVSYLALRESFIGFVHDYLQYGPTIASIHDPLLRFFFLTFRCSIVLTEMGILCWEWYAPIEPIAIAETESVAIEVATPVVLAIPPEIPLAIEAIAEPETINLDPLAFDPETGMLSFHGKSCEIPFKTYQHALCAKLFERPGVRVDEKDIMRAIDWEMDKADSDRLVKDAVYAVNRKAEAELGIEKILVWKKFTAWVNDEYVSDFLGG
jgi:hypothetical protein